jgi:Kef-type K+ transport system membrane component KefB
MQGDHPVMLVIAVGILAPLLAEIPIGLRLPVVVLEVLLGILIGPEVLGLVEQGAFLEAMYAVGTAAVLFMAGMELDFAQIRGRPLTLALGGWGTSVALGFLAVALLHVIPGVEAPMMVTIALTTTGLATLIPILRDGGQLETAFGRLLLAAGTVGEVGPIVAVSLILSDRYSSWQEAGFLLVFLALVAGAAAIGIGARPPAVLDLLARTLRQSTQLPVRLALFLMAGLGVIAAEIGFERILGAFAAGMIVGLATRGREGEPFRAKIDAVCFGFLTPFFFVGTGIAFDPGALTRDLTTMILVPSFLLLFLIVRGVPVLLYRRELTGPERLPFALSSSVASLGLVVVITQVGLRTKTMDPDIAQALVGAALLSLLVYPTLAGFLLSRRAAPAS